MAKIQSWMMERVRDRERERERKCRGKNTQGFLITEDAVAQWYMCREGSIWMCVYTKIIFCSTPEHGNSPATSQILTETSPYLSAGLFLPFLWYIKLIECPTL